MSLENVLRLARSGALERAWSVFEASGLAESSEPGALTLKARLIKDRARRATGSEAARLFAEAATTYALAARPGSASYPLINAATLSLLAGRRQQAEQLALQVLDVLEVDPGEAETPYWLRATRAEALLLLGRLPEARAALRAAVAEAPQAWEDRAATISQLVAICGELGCDAAWLDQFRPPRSLQYSGIMGVRQSDAKTQASIAKWLETENVGFGFGALAAGSDIWIAEALVERGASLNVVLPCPADVFRERSVAAVDPAWVPRFDCLLAAADSVDELDTAPAPSPAAVRLTDAASLGLAIHTAQVLQTEPLRLRLAGSDDARHATRPTLPRLMTLAAARRPAARDFRVDEAGSAVAMIRSGTGKPRFFDGPLEAWTAALTEAVDGQPVALDFRFVGEDEPGAEATRRLDAIAGATERGQILASKAVAFALLSEAPGVRVEAMGEIRSAAGFLPIYALH